MKKLNTLFLSIALTATLFSCSKDDETPTYKQSDLIGEWELSSSSEDEYNLCATQNDVLIISEETFYEKSYDDDCSSLGGAEYSYAFDGKDKLTLMGGFAINKITKLSSTEVRFEQTSPLAEGKKIILVYKK